MEYTTISFYPVDCGDCILLEIKNGPKMMWDCNFRRAAKDEEKEDVYDVLNDLLNDKLTAKKYSLPFLDAFVLTPADQKNCRSFSEKFYTGDPNNISNEDKKAQKILIGELWYSPRVIVEDDNLCEDSKIFKQEAERRMNLFKTNPQEANKDGNRIRIIGWVKEDKLEGLESRIATPRDEISEVNGKKYSHFRMFIHAPFKDDIKNATRNETSIVMQIRIDCDGKIDAGKIVLSGDCEWPVWEKIVEKSSDNKLKWDILEAPHHCSWSYFGPDRESGEIKEAALTFLDKKERGAVVVSSSKYITRYDSTPPCEKAKNRYVEKVSESNFFCTGGNKKDDKPAPVVFELKNNGFHIVKKSDNKKAENTASPKQPHVYGEIL